mmetsp:Transcript_77714/g.204058  ORF Transcript_77714/g.204058 Transcript_77714/m.204058 type:complete len:200 (-) Transcript_77714:117-716(-)
MIHDARVRFLSEHAVQNHRHWLVERVEQNQEHPQDGHQLRADDKTVLEAHGLRQDLAERHHDEGRRHEAHGAAGEGVQQDRHAAVDRNVAEQHRAEEKVPVLPHGQNPLRPPRVLQRRRIPALRALDQHLQLARVQGHEPEVQAAEGCGKERQDQDREDLERHHPPLFGRRGLLGHGFCGEGATGRPGGDRRHTLDRQI